MSYFCVFCGGGIFIRDSCVLQTFRTYLKTIQLLAVGVGWRFIIMTVHMYGIQAKYFQNICWIKWIIMKRLWSTMKFS